MAERTTAANVAVPAKPSVPPPPPPPAPGSSPSWVRIQRWCACGGHLDARSSPPGAAIEMDARFGEVHQGEGHAPTDARGARNARRRQERALLRGGEPS